MKKYEVTYAPSIRLAKEVANPYDMFDLANISVSYLYVDANNYHRKYTEKVIVEAPNKEIAKAMFAVEIYKYGEFRHIKGGIEPLVYDAVRNIKEIVQIG
ncbi:hypothetical protein COJ96_06810 [Bacillus sp. AFS073361]|uniref:hypothetical protein n=1 Tax=Bacillus sp. AFS073361 TaxID=2033511 RepID=UPI000BF355B7|nr:hypothetical protein [Bacillus sp. AFS073361]PFP30124.1 hypothetical protein COJ96_06810 [Bacillus sp. AFS073361]